MKLFFVHEVLRPLHVKLIFKSAMMKTTLFAIPLLSFIALTTAQSPGYCTFAPDKSKSGRAAAPPARPEKTPVALALQITRLTAL